MKNLPDMKLGEHTVQLTAEHLPHEHAIEFTATCGATIRAARMTLPAHHSYTKDELQVNINQHLEKLANEAAGHEQANRLAQDFVKE